MIWAALTLSLSLTDAHQSVRCVELNPIARPLVNHPVALYSVKLGTSALVLTGAHSLRKAGHPRAAFWYLVAVNAAQGAVVLHNWRTK